MLAKGAGGDCLDIFHLPIISFILSGRQLDTD